MFDNSHKISISYGEMNKQDRSTSYSSVKTTLSEITAWPSDAILFGKSITKTFRMNKIFKQIPIIIVSRS